MSPQSRKRRRVCSEINESGESEAPSSFKSIPIKITSNKAFLGPTKGIVNQTVAEISKKMYSKIVPEQMVKHPEVPEENKYSVYEFYDEEDEKQKIKQMEERAKQQELKERTCKLVVFHFTLLTTNKNKMFQNLPNSIFRPIGCVTS